MNRARELRQGGPEIRSRESDPRQDGASKCQRNTFRHSLLRQAHSVAMGIVEVKDTEQHCFYRAKLLDVKQDKCLVQYEEAGHGLGVLLGWGGA